MKNRKSDKRRPPLSGLRVVEFGGIGPGPFACMILAGLGADVVRIDRPDFDLIEPGNSLLRGRTRVSLDLKDPSNLAIVKKAVGLSDVLIEGFRPGVMERLGLGPKVFEAANPGLVYARMTGWGQDGPLKDLPGHDINYLSISGVLDTIGREGDPPLAPLNYVADYGSGAMLLVVGVLAALFKRSDTGKGDVIDIAMVDGAALMLADVLSRFSQGDWIPRRGSNLYDSGAPFYDVYETSDERFMAVGAIEPQFYSTLLNKLGLVDLDPTMQLDKRKWPEVRKRLQEAFSSKNQSEWTEIFEKAEACVTPVIPLSEALNNPQMRYRNSFVEVDGLAQPAPAPRFADSAAVIDAAVEASIYDVINRWQ